MDVLKILLLFLAVVAIPINSHISPPFGVSIRDAFGPVLCMPFGECFGEQPSGMRARVNSNRLSGSCLTGQYGWSFVKTSEVVLWSVSGETVRAKTSKRRWRYPREQTSGACYGEDSRVDTGSRAGASGGYGQCGQSRCKTCEGHRDSVWLGSFETSWVVLRSVLLGQQRMVETL